MCKGAEKQLSFTLALLRCLNSAVFQGSSSQPIAHLFDQRKDYAAGHRR